MDLVKVLVDGYKECQRNGIEYCKFNREDIGKGDYACLLIYDTENNMLKYKDFCVEYENVVGYRLPIIISVPFVVIGNKNIGDSILRVFGDYPFVVNYVSVVSGEYCPYDTGIDNLVLRYEIMRQKKYSSNAETMIIEEKSRRVEDLTAHVEEKVELGKKIKGVQDDFNVLYVAYRSVIGERDRDIGLVSDCRGMDNKMTLDRKKKKLLRKALSLSKIIADDDNILVSRLEEEYRQYNKVYNETQNVIQSLQEQIEAQKIIIEKGDILRLGLEKEVEAQKIVIEKSDIVNSILEHQVIGSRCPPKEKGIVCDEIDELFDSFCGKR